MLALVWFPQAARATFAGRNGSILFERNYSYYKVSVGGRPHLFVPMQPAGTPRPDGPAAVDRSGRRLAFGSYQRGFYLARLHRPALHLVDLGRSAETPAWSPDGQRVVVRYGGGTIATVTTQGRDVTKFGFGWDPSWSSRGELAYLGNSGVVVRNPADSASKSYVAHTDPHDFSPE